MKQITQIFLEGESPTLIAGFSDFYLRTNEGVIHSCSEKQVLQVTIPPVLHY